ncbi:hypothetical protein [Pedobacter agri]|uniref:hypothetical protein n=1 Tax=Pedobacter agri TaxID=454586 RepID=UPI0029316CB3|nr:hypothetical protein [Pedobacter agri]
MLQRYLIIGLIMSITFIFGGCIRDDFRDWYGECPYLNSTNHHINIDTINIPPKTTKIKTRTYRITGKRSDVSNYASSYDNIPTYNIKFNNSKCLMDVKKNDENSIINIKNYTAERVNDVTYKFTYTFTEADYHRAANCP